VAPLTDSQDLTLDDAYAVQRALTTLRLNSGERVIGWKLGYTSLAMREQMNVRQPNFGPLTDAMLLSDGQAVGRRFTQPRVEPEIAIRLVAPLRGRVSRLQVSQAVGQAVACLEVVDSVYEAYRFTLADNTADGSSAAGLVLGDDLADDVALDEVTVRLERNGKLAGTATGAAASGHPLDGVVWLVGQMADRGLGLEAGQVVITGGLTSAVPLDPGDLVVAAFGSTAHVSLRG
jgi:2-keto-4-pentenoate hydratase